MTPLHADIIRTIEKHGPITSEDIAERLTELGYGGGNSFGEFKRQVSKIASKMKASGKIIGDDIPIPGAKPMRVYQMVENEEMASDVADVEIPATEDSSVAQANDDAKWEAFRMDPIELYVESAPETVTPEPTVLVEVKVEHHPMTVQQALANKPQWMGGNEFTNFLLGIEAAEKHHGIGQ